MRWLIYVAGFLLGLTTALPAYINSSFLAEIVGEKRVGLIFSITAILASLGIFFISQLINRLEPARFILYAGTISLTSLVTLVTFGHTKNLILIISSFSVYFVCNILISLTLDFLLETTSEDNSTGRIRGFYLTVVNIAWLASPFLAGMLVTNNNYEIIYLIASVTLLPVLGIALYYQTHSSSAKTTKQQNFSLKTIAKIFDPAETIRIINLRRILVIEFLLNFFYAVMLIYAPFYLNTYLGFDWITIGQILTVMLVPFVILDYPLGLIADKWLGEKELLTAGLIIMALTTLPIAFYAGQTLVWWALILFATRVGAATVEIMKETYLFKKISADDLDVLSLSRLTTPLALIIAPLSASIFLLFFPFRFIFLALSIIVALGLTQSLRLIDTR
ncbi:MAG: MFS transporter [Patescibacteria group bacterium]